MGATLNIADQKRAYTLTDRGTYLAQRQRLDLVILFEGDARLRNVYHVYAVNPAKHPKAKRAEARAFIDFLVSAPVQQAIAAFKREEYGQSLFFPDALPRPRSHAWVNSSPTRPSARSSCARSSSPAPPRLRRAGRRPGRLRHRPQELPGRTILLGFINTGMGMPPVVVGLVVWVLLVRSGPFGDLGLIYTRQAMVLAQFLIATPIVDGIHDRVVPGAVAAPSGFADRPGRGTSAHAVASGEGSQARPSRGHHGGVWRRSCPRSARR